VIERGGIDALVEGVAAATEVLDRRKIPGGQRPAPAAGVSALAEGIEGLAQVYRPVRIRDRLDRALMIEVQVAGEGA
jgi:hypothetical protein